MLVTGLIGGFGSCGKHLSLAGQLIFLSHLSFEYKVFTYIRFAFDFCFCEGYSNQAEASAIVTRLGFWNDWKEAGSPRW